MMHFIMHVSLKVFVEKNWVRLHLNLQVSDSIKSWLKCFVNWIEMTYRCIAYHGADHKWVHPARHLHERWWETTLIEKVGHWSLTGMSFFFNFLIMHFSTLSISILEFVPFLNWEEILST